MILNKKYLVFLLPVLLLLQSHKSWGKSVVLPFSIFSEHLRSDTDTIHGAKNLPYPFTDQSGDAPPLYNPDGGLRLSNPSNIKTDVEYNPLTGKYDIYQKVGSMDYRIPTEMDSDQYEDYMFQQSEHKYFQQKVQTTSKEKQQNKSLIPPIHIGGNLFKDIFGSNTVNIRPQGSAELTFGFNNSKIQNPALPVAQRSLTTFNFDENIQLNVTGEIGDKLKLSTNYNTKATFDFQNQMKLQFTGHEDDIIKSIDAGNVSFTLPGTLITGSQSLFGIKTKLQFGRLTSTTVYAQEKGNKKTITVQNGSQTTNFNVKVDQYMANQHFFLSHFFRDNYDKAMSTPPIINSGITITKIEVWVTNISGTTTNTRDILAFSDLGEGSNYETDPHGGPVTFTTANGPPNNAINSLDPGTPGVTTPPGSLLLKYPNVAIPTQAITALGAAGFTQVQDYEKVDLARMLSPSEYTLNARLGYISLKQPLNYDQVLGVAYQYTYNGQTYQVGQFSTDGVPTTNELVLKMLKSTNVTPYVPLWKLMMKNIYALGSFQINSQNFMLNIWYSNPTTGVDIPYLPTGSLADRPLLQVMGLDQLDAQGDREPDGLFDFVQGVTIDAANGLVIFPGAEPFGSYLRNKLTLAGYPATSINNYVFQSLYDSVIVAAQEQPNLDRYWLRGSFQSSASSDISLGAMNVPQGSVLVTAGGIKLTENVDYTVDYTLGRVKILNQGLLSSGTPIQVSLENNALFSIESKTFFGQHFDYLVSKDFNLGATVVNYTEHPLTQIVSIGQEPVSNTMIGLNGDFKKDAPFLTRWIDALPFIHTKAPSEITASSEVAYMIPGHPKFIGSTGNAYIDNFDGSESFIDISQPFSWSLASVPSTFREASLNDSVASGFNRAKMAWYVVDPLFQQYTSGLTPNNINNSTDLSMNFTRMVLQTEIFPQEQSPTGTPLNLPVLNVAFYPQLRGPYNYDVKPTLYSAGVNGNGQLNSPTTRWGGIQRPIQETDFEDDNIAYIEFWMMDPFNADNTPLATDSNLMGPNSSGTLYFDVGDVSEDVLKDGLMSFENGLPTNSADAADSANINNPYTNSKWGRVPVNPSLVDAFNNDPTTRPFQDIGLDGLADADERNKFSYYLNALSSAYGPGSGAYQGANNDPSTDNYKYYRDDGYDANNVKVLQRYMMYNGLEGNSPTQQQYGSENPNGGNYPTTQSTLPNTEDINQDHTLSQDEAYYEYAVKMDPKNVNVGNVGNNYITDVLQTTVSTPAGTKPITWYQFKIPLANYTRKVGPISDFHSIRFIRLYMAGFDKPIICRFAKLELVRDDWRKFTGSLLSPGEVVPTDENLTVFDVFGVNLEENGANTPVNYVIPPGIQRQLNLQSANLVQMNEGSLGATVCDLQDGDARGVYKNVQLDLRAYKNIQMFIHCQSDDPAHPLKTGDVTAFIRLGSDFTSNYYEYEIPLQVTPAGSYSTTNNNDQTTVWPTANDLDVALSKLESVKLARDAAMGNASSGVSLLIPFTQKDGVNNITVVGNPTLSNLQVIMLGVRNPRRTAATATTDDGLPKCAEVWFDELRMTDFNEKGGGATINRVTAKLADLGTLSLAGNLTTPGFGSLETTVGNLSRETDEGFSLATNLEMGKFFPQTWNLSVPMYIGLQEQRIIPEYNPLDPDILLSDDLSSLTKQQQDTLKSKVISVNIQKSINFTNVHKNKGKNSKKSHFWDIENFALTYAFTQQTFHDVNTEEKLNRSYKGGLIYNYSFHPKNIQPFAKWDFFKKRKFLSLVGDFNFFPMPDKLSAAANFDREYGEYQIRNTIPGVADLPPFPISVNKIFNMTRTYNLTFPITKSLKFEYTATDDARIMEPEGLPIRTQDQRDSVKNAIFNHQVNTDFKQTVSLNYEVPINKIPYLDFLTLTAHYAGSYSWIHAPFAADSLGATIQNSATKQLNGQINFTTLYNKIPFLKKMLQADKKNQQQPQGRGLNKNPQQGKNNNNQNNQQPQDTGKGKSVTYQAGQILVHLITMVKNVSFTYSNNTGILLPGYNYNSSILGMDPANQWAPGPSFVSGIASDTATFLKDVRNHSWLVKLQNAFITPVSAVNTQTFSIHASLEPLPDMKVDLTATRTYSLNSSFYYRDSLGHYLINTPTESGNFSMSYFMLPTVFKGNSLASPLFQNFLQFRVIISQRLAFQSGNHSTRQLFGAGTDTAHYDGYSQYSQNVVIPAFLAAYSGQSPYKISLNPFPSIPLPNFTLTYSGLAKLVPWVKKHLQSVILSSAYSSNYSVGSFNYNLLFAEDQYGMPVVRGLAMGSELGDFLPRDQINAVTLSDQFSPLIKIAVTLKNNIMSNLEIRTERQIMLNLSDVSINETHSQEYILGVGYRIKNVPMPFKLGSKPIKSDLNFKVDFSLRENETILRNSINLSNQVTGGQTIISIKPSAEYIINTRVSFRLYFDKIINTPAISSSYPTSTMDGGIALRFTLS